MGERRARWGYGYQDKVATERILNFLRKDLREGNGTFEGVRLAIFKPGESMTLSLFGRTWSRVIQSNGLRALMALRGASLSGLQGSSRPCGRVESTQEPLEGPCHHRAPSYQSTGFERNTSFTTNSFN